mgnify:CR=1 FL=1
MGPLHLALEYRIALYADDVLLFMAHLSLTEPRLFHILNAYSQASGLCVNWPKSLLVPLRGDSSTVSWQSRLTVRRLSFFGI